MKYDFKVKAEAFRCFCDEEDEEVVRGKIGDIKNEFEEFSVTYNTNVEAATGTDFFSVMEGTSDIQQILMHGFVNGSRTTLASIFVGEEFDELGNVSDWYKEGLEDFKEIQKYKIES